MITSPGHVPRRGHCDVRFCHGVSWCGQARVGPARVLVLERADAHDGA